MGSARVAFILLLLEERNFAEVGTFQPSLGFKDFHQAARLHPRTNGHPRRRPPVRWWGEASRAAASAPPSASRIFIILAGAEGELSWSLPSRGLASRFFLRLLGVETILQLCEGSTLQPCRGRRTAAAQSRVQHSVFCPGDGGQPHQGVSQHVVRREGGTRVLGRSHSRFRGEDGSEDLPMRFGAPDARWCGVGGQVDAAGAEVVAAGESLSANETVSATRGPTSGSLALMSGSRPSSGDTNESLPAVASALGPLLLLQGSLASHPEFVVPQALRCGGCSYPREWNRSSVCNGTLSAGVCSLWLSRPEHLGIFGAIPCFFLISSTRTRLSASWTA
jgi:hypothetical protein